VLVVLRLLAIALIVAVVSGRGGVPALVSGVAMLGAMILTAGMARR
jgi:hypothetical protein